MLILTVGDLDPSRPQGHTWGGGRCVPRDEEAAVGVANRMMRAGNAAHVALYRRFDVGFLRSVRGMPVLLLTVAGRSSGTLRTSPVGYFRDGGAYVVCGSAGGAAAEPQWFRNLRHADTAVIEVGDERIEVDVEVAHDAERDRLWRRLLEVAPFFGGYEARAAGRVIPLAALTPRASASPAP
jgi:deazaflavin-dependent oxidoreductase (nitroreductase family)